MIEKFVFGKRIVEIQKVGDIYKCKIQEGGKIYKGEHYKKIEAFMEADSYTNSQYDYLKVNM